MDSLTSLAPGKSRAPGQHPASPRLRGTQLIRLLLGSWVACSHALSVLYAQWSDKIALLVESSCPGYNARTWRCALLSWLSMSSLTGNSQTVAALLTCQEVAEHPGWLL